MFQKKFFLIFFYFVSKSPEELDICYNNPPKNDTHKIFSGSFFEFFWPSSISLPKVAFSAFFWSESFACSFLWFWRWLGLFGPDYYHNTTIAKKGSWKYILLPFTKRYFLRCLHYIFLRECIHNYLPWFVQQAAKKYCSVLH